VVNDVGVCAVQYRNATLSALTTVPSFHKSAFSSHDTLLPTHSQEQTHTGKKEEEGQHTRMVEVCQGFLFRNASPPPPILIVCYSALFSVWLFQHIPKRDATCYVQFVQLVA